MLQPEDSDSDSGDGREQSDDEAEDIDTLFAADSSGGGAELGMGTLERRGTSSGGTLGRDGSAKAPAAVQHIPDEADLHASDMELYVLVARCIAFPFSAQAKTSMGYTRHHKLCDTDLQQYCGQFEKFHKGAMPNITSDELFDKAILCYYDNFLISRRLLSLVTSGGCTYADLRKVFQNYVEKFLKNLPLMERVAHDHVLSIWMSKYEAICHGSDDMETFRRESIKNMHERQNLDDSVAPEQLYKVFQDILGIPQREHHLVAKELQLDNADEQATIIRRELRHRIQHLDNTTHTRVSSRLASRDPNIVQDYIAEQHTHIAQLSKSLNQMPISKRNETLKKGKPAAAAGFSDQADIGSIGKNDISISTSVELSVLRARGLEFLLPDKPVFCVMEMEGHPSKMATTQYPASRPIWDTLAKFPTTTPLPMIRIKLMADSKSLLDADGKQIAKVILQPTLDQPGGDKWYQMQASVSLPDKNHKIEVQANICMKPAVNVKISGWLYCVGDETWKRWRRHYFLLVQMTTYAFALCTFREKQQTPADIMDLTGCTVNYSEGGSRRGVGDEGYTEYQFTVMKLSGGVVTFCCAAPGQMEQWVYHLARATGQPQRPQAPQSSAGSKAATLKPGPKSTSNLQELNLSSNFLNRDITSFDHPAQYTMLLQRTLDHRLQDPTASMGWLTPGQQFVLDEYQSRYCLRGFVTQSSMLQALMDHASKGVYINASLMHYSFTFCAAHIQGQKPDNYRSVTKDEKEVFEDLIDKLHHLLRDQLERLSHSFPFCLPDGGLKAALRLFARVTTQRDPKVSVTAEVCDCLKKAALQCYKDVGEDVENQMAEVEEVNEIRTDTLAYLVNLSEECIDQMGQCQVDYSKAFSDHHGALTAFEESFWSFFQMDLEQVLVRAALDDGKVFQVFEQLNSYLLNHASMKDGKFHNHLLVKFMPLVASYLDIATVNMEREMVLCIAEENWKPDQSCARCADDLFTKLRGLRRFVQRLAWPEPLFADHLEKRVQRAISDLLLSLCRRTHKIFRQLLAKQQPRAEALYIAPRQIWVMIDVLTASIEQAQALAIDTDDDSTFSGVEYGANTLEALAAIQGKMKLGIAELLNFTVEDLLEKLSLHDPANLVRSFFNKLRSSQVDLDDLSASVEHNLQTMHESASSTPAIDVVMTWYESMLAHINDWLEEHPPQSLKFVQFDTLQGAVEVIVHRFLVHFTTEQDARVPLLTAVEDRLKLEQSAAELADVADAGY